MVESDDNQVGHYQVGERTSQDPTSSDDPKWWVGGVENHVRRRLLGGGQELYALAGHGHELRL